jgi:hypothetical protein
MGELRSIGNNPYGRVNGISDRWRRLSGEVPTKSAYRYVRFSTDVKSTMYSLSDFKSICISGELSIEIYDLAIVGYSSVLWNIDTLAKFASHIWI